VSPNELLISFIQILTWVLYIALIGRVVSSFLHVGPSNPLYPVVVILYQITEPILAPIRRILPKFGMLDFSPMVVIFLITFLQPIVVNALR
jgi:YggT family protein